MSEVQVTAESVMDSLTGHDEMAIAEYFGRTVAELVSKDPLMLSRAMVFVTKRREAETSDVEARDFAMSLAFKNVLAYFLDPDEESEVEGKDEPEPEVQPEPSLSSVS